MDKTIIDVICVLHKNKDYTEDQVNRLRKQVSTFLSKPHRFVCLSDVPVKDCDLNIPLVHNFQGKWCKMELYRPDLLLNQQILYFDLDTIILDNIDCFVCPEDFVLREPSTEYRTKKTKKGKQRIRKYNSAIMSFKKNSRPEIWDDFNKKIRDTFFYDQDYLGYIIPNEKTFPSDWSQKFYPDKHEEKPDTKVVCFCGNNKSHKFSYSWIKENYEKFAS